ncbi:MAG: carbohydrate ABC transporter permease [Fibrobacterota bacterium]
MGHQRSGSSSLRRLFLDIWPLIPTAVYLLTSLILVIIYLIRLAFTVDGVFPSGEAARRVFEDPEFSSALVNTLFFVIVGTPLELFLGLLLALLLYNARFMKRFLRAVFTMPMAVPGLVIAALFFILFDSQGGFINQVLMGEYAFFPRVIEQDINWNGNRWFSLLLSIMGKVWCDMPLAMLIILSGLNTVDATVFDAAKTLGAGFRKRLTTIVIPLIFPAIKTVLLLRSIEMWKAFIFPYVLSGKHYLLGTLVEHYYNGFGGQPDKASVVAIILLLCVLGSLTGLYHLLRFIENKLTNGGAYAAG